MDECIEKGERTDRNEDRKGELVNTFSFIIKRKNSIYC